MRSSALLLLALAALAVAPHRAAAEQGQTVAGFCGSLPPGRMPPWQPKPLRPTAPDTACHLMLCDRRKIEEKGRGRA